MLTIHYGDIIAYFADIIWPVLGSLLLFGLRKLPGQIGQIFMTMQAEQLLGKALSYAKSAVAGATEGKTVDVAIANDVIRQAVDYALQHGPEYLISWLGGKDNIVQMIIARLNLGSDAQVVTSELQVVPAAQPAAPTSPAA